MANSLRDKIEAILDHAAFWNDGQDVSATLEKIMTAIEAERLNK